MIEGTIKSKEDFNRIFNKGKRRTGKYLTLIIDGGEKRNRIGVVVSGKYGGAVLRNKVKRQIKEAYRALGREIKGILDMIVIPRQQAKKAKTGELIEDIREILSRMQAL